VFKIPLLYKK